MWRDKDIQAMVGWKVGKRGRFFGKWRGGVSEVSEVPEVSKVAGVSKAAGVSGMRYCSNINCLVDESLPGRQRLYLSFIGRI